MAARASKGEVVRNPTRDGFTFALRFTAYNKPRYLTLGRPEDGWTEAKAETELENILADVRRGIWQPHTIEAPPEAPRDPGFHEFASAWFDAIRGEMRPNTVLDYEWQLPTRRRWTDTAPGGSDTPRPASHLRIRAGRARQGPALRDGPTRAHRPDSHTRHLRAGNDLKRRRPRAAAAACGRRRPRREISANEPRRRTVRIQGWAGENRPCAWGGIIGIPTCIGIWICCAIFANARPRWFSTILIAGPLKV
jgi:hypothetical protein